MNVAERIISLERSALDRWIRANPDGYLDLYANDATYFDPFVEAGRWRGGADHAAGTDA